MTDPYPDPKQEGRKRRADYLVIERTAAGAKVHRFRDRVAAESFVDDNAGVSRTPRELNPEQRAALDAARKAQRRFERAQLAYEQASDERASAFTAALDSGITYGEMADFFGVPRGSIQASAAGRARKR